MGFSHAASSAAEQQRLRELCLAASSGSPQPTARLLRQRACSPGSLGLPLPPAVAGTGWRDLRAMLVGKQPLLPPSQPPSFPSGASLCWAVLDASGALLLLSQSCSAPAELARLSHIGGDGKAGLELDSVYKTTEINRNSMAGSRAETALLKGKKKKKRQQNFQFICAVSSCTKDLGPSHFHITNDYNNREF